MLLFHLHQETLVPLPWLSAIRVVSSAYLRLLIFCPATLIQTCDSSSPLCKMYSAYKLNKQDDNVQPWCTPFPILNYCSILGSNCFFLTCIQISQEAGKLVWRSFHSLLWYPQSKAFAYSVKQKWMFFWNSLAFSMIQPMFAVWPQVPLHFLNPDCIFGSSWFMYYWSLKDFEDYLAGVWNKCSFMVIWTLFCIALL